MLTDLNLLAILVVVIYLAVEVRRRAFADAVETRALIDRKIERLLREFNVRCNELSRQITVVQLCLDLHASSADLDAQKLASYLDSITLPRPSPPQDSGNGPEPARSEPTAR